MLTGIGLRNFKAFGKGPNVLSADEHGNLTRTDTAPLSKITLIYGPNSGGKSSIIQALLLLRQSLRSIYSHLIPSGLNTYIDLVSFHSLIHRHDELRELRVAVKYRNMELGCDCAENEVGMRFDLDADDGTGFLHEVSYKITRDGSLLLDAPVIPIGPPFQPFQRGSTSGLTIMGFSSERQCTNTSHEFLPFIELTELHDKRRNVLRTLETIETREARAQVQALHQARASRMPDPENTFQQRELQELTLSHEEILALTPENIPHDYEHHLHLLNYLGPLRSPPERFYKFLPYDGASSGITGSKGEFSANVLFRDSTARKAVNDWFEQFKIPYELNVEKWGKASVTGEHITIFLNDKWTDTQVTLADVGYGVNQLLPVIIEGIASQEGSIICVEQPELHLHPSLQANVADLMIDTIDENDDKRKQWIVETHSELLVRRIQTRIAQGDVSPSDVSILYVDPEDDDFEGSAIKQLRLDDTGSWLDEWPHGFFEEGHEQTMAVVNARMKKRASGDARERQMNRRAKNGAN